MNRERLELMVTMLNEVAAGTWRPAPLPDAAVQYLMDEGYEVGSREEQPKFDLTEWLIPADYINDGDCGYAACAVGHAMLDARFNALGLVGNQYGNPQIQDPYCTNGRVLEGWTAVREFFGIPYYAASRLFGDEEYTTRGSPLAVAERVTKLLETTE